MLQPCQRSQEGDDAPFYLYLVQLVLLGLQELLGLLQPDDHGPFHLQLDVPDPFYL